MVLLDHTALLAEPRTPVVAAFLVRHLPIRMRGRARPARRSSFSSRSRAPRRQDRVGRSLLRTDRDQQRQQRQRHRQVRPVVMKAGARRRRACKTGAQAEIAQPARALPATEASAVGRISGAAAIVAIMLVTHLRAEAGTALPKDGGLTHAGAGVRVPLRQSTGTETGRAGANQPSPHREGGRGRWARGGTRTGALAQKASAAGCHLTPMGRPRELAPRPAATPPHITGCGTDSGTGTATGPPREAVGPALGDGHPPPTTTTTTSHVMRGGAPVAVAAGRPLEALRQGPEAATPPPPPHPSSQACRSPARLHACRPGPIAPGAARGRRCTPAARQTAGGAPPPRPGRPAAAQGPLVTARTRAPAGMTSGGTWAVAGAAGAGRLHPPQLRPEQECPASACELAGFQVATTVGPFACVNARYFIQHRVDLAVRTRTSAAPPSRALTGLSNSQATHAHTRL